MSSDQLKLNLCLCYWVNEAHSRKGFFFFLSLTPAYRALGTVHVYYPLKTPILWFNAIFILYVLSLTLFALMHYLLLKHNNCINDTSAGYFINTSVLPLFVILKLRIGVALSFQVWVWCGHLHRVGRFSPRCLRWDHVGCFLSKEEASVQVPSHRQYPLRPSKQH